MINELSQRHIPQRDSVRKIETHQINEESKIVKAILKQEGKYTERAQTLNKYVLLP